MVLGKLLEIDSFMELLFSLVGCPAVWAFAALSFRSVVPRVMMTMMTTGMVEFISDHKRSRSPGIRIKVRRELFCNQKRDNYNNAAYNNAAFTNNKRAGGGGGTEYI